MPSISSVCSSVFKVLLKLFIICPLTVLQKWVNFALDLAKNSLYDSSEPKKRRPRSNSAALIRSVESRLTRENEKLVQEIKRLKNENDKLDIEIRRSNLVFCGIPEENSKETETELIEKVRLVLREGLKFEADIDTAKRIGPIKADCDRPRPICVRFLRQEQIHSIFNIKVKLKDNPKFQNIYINHNLPPRIFKCKMDGRSFKKAEEQKTLELEKEQEPIIKNNTNTGDDETNHDHDHKNQPELAHTEAELNDN